MNNWDYETNYNQLDYSKYDTKSLEDCANYCANKSRSNLAVYSKNKECSCYELANGKGNTTTLTRNNNYVNDSQVWNSWWWLSYIVLAIYTVFLAFLFISIFFVKVPNRKGKL